MRMLANGMKKTLTGVTQKQAAESAITGTFKNGGANIPNQRRDAIFGAAPPTGANQLSKTLNMGDMKTRAKNKPIGGGHKIRANDAVQRNNPTTPKMQQFHSRSPRQEADLAVADMNASARPGPNSTRRGPTIGSSQGAGTSHYKNKNLNSVKAPKAKSIPDEYTKGNTSTASSSGNTAKGPVEHGPASSNIGGPKDSQANLKDYKRQFGTSLGNSVDKGTIGKIEDWMGVSEAGRKYNPQSGTGMMAQGSDFASHLWAGNNWDKAKKIGATAAVAGSASRMLTGSGTPITDEHGNFDIAGIPFI